VSYKDVEIALVRGENSKGVAIYSYVAIYPDMAKKLKQELLCKTTTLNDYGVVIASGEGEPSEEVQAYIQTTYLMDKSTS
jgi:hypothetical protein